MACDAYFCVETCEYETKKCVWWRFSAAPVNSLQQFRVITQGAGKADFAIAITSPSGSKVKAHVIPTHEGFLVNFTPTELGEYLLSVSFGGEPLPQAPLRFVCMPGSDYTKVCASSRLWQKMDLKFAMRFQLIVNSDLKSSKDVAKNFREQKDDLLV